MGSPSTGPVGFVTSNAHTGLGEAIGAALPGAGWQRCRTHYAANLMAVTPKSQLAVSQSAAHSVYDQRDTDALHAQFDRTLEALREKLPTVAEQLDAARGDTLAFTAYPRR